MAMSDPLGDMLTRIRNGQMANKTSVEIPHSKLRENVCRFARMKALFVALRLKSENNKKVLVVELKYAEGRGVIRQIDRVSKPGPPCLQECQKICRVFITVWVFWFYRHRQGVISDQKARAANVGGEVFCQVF